LNKDRYIRSLNPFPIDEDLKRKVLEESSHFPGNLKELKIGSEQLRYISWMLSADQLDERTGQISILIQVITD